MNPYELASVRRSSRSHAEDQSTVIDKKDLFTEVSFSESDIFKALYSYGQNPDPVARIKGLQIYRDMLEDDQIKACLELRKQARLSTPWMIHSAEEGNAQADEYADFINFALNNMDGTFADNLYNMYSAIDFGFSITEKVLKIYDTGPYQGKIGLGSLKTREPFNYDFKTDVHGNLLGIVYSGAGAGLLTPQQKGKNLPSETLGTNENPFPVDKFIIYSYNRQFSNWYGRSDLLAAYRSWTIKKHVMKFWNIWLERYASPFVWAQYKRDAGMKKTSLEEIDSFLKNLSAKQSLRVSDAVDLKTFQSSTAGGDAYERAVEAHNRYISHALLCPNLLGISNEQTGGSFALGRKQFDSFVWTLEKLGRDTSEYLVFEQIIKPLIQLNFPNVDEDQLPTFKFESVEEGSIAIRARILTILSNGGFINPDEDWVREFLSLPKLAQGVTLNPPQPKGPFGGGGESIPGDDTDREERPDDDELPPEAKLAEKKAAEEKRLSEEKKKRFQERQANQFETKVRVNQFKQQLENAETRIVKALTPALEDARDALVDSVMRKRIVIEGDLGAVNKLVVNMGDFKKELRIWLVKVHLDSKLQALEELKRGGVEAEITKKFADVPFYDWEPLPPQEAVDFFNRKVLVKVRKSDGSLVAIDLATGRELSYYDEKAFTISGIVREDILNGAKNIILNGIKRQDETGTIKDLKNMFNKYLAQGIAVDDEVLEPHRLATIVRTNMVEAVNEGRRAMYEDPVVGDFVQYFQYSAIIDDRTTDYCECMDERIFRIEDLPLLNPPAHFNCRSFTVPITRMEIDDLAKEGSGVELSEPCPDRAAGFSERKGDPLFVPKGVENLKVPAKPAPEVEPDLAPQPKASKDEEALRKLKDELEQIIVRCPYSTCRSTNIRMTGQKFNVGEFACDDCSLPFRVANTGDLYLYDAGTDTWTRTTHGVYPASFREKKRK